MLAKADIQDRDIVGGLEKGLAVIEAFDERRVRLSLSEVAQITGAHAGGARRYLLTLQSLLRGKRRHVLLADAEVLRLGYAYLSSMTLPSRCSLSSSESRISCTSRVPPQCWTIWKSFISPVPRRVGSCRLAWVSAAGCHAYCKSLGRILLAYQRRRMG
jgi:hypothetical protein